jgi:hypothetical protein
MQAAYEEPVSIPGFEQPGFELPGFEQPVAPLSPTRGPLIPAILILPLSPTQPILVTPLSSTHGPLTPIPSISPHPPGHLWVPPLNPTRTPASSDNKPDLTLTPKLDVLSEEIRSLNK